MARDTPFEVIVYRDDQPAALPRMGGSAGWGETDQQCYVPLRAGRPANPGRDRRRLVWRGQARCSVIVAEGERWNDVVFVEYPSRRDLERMVTTPEYQIRAALRTAALEHSCLIATTGPRISAASPGGY